jgi:hypothetical protein
MKRERYIAPSIEWFYMEAHSVMADSTGSGIHGFSGGEVITGDIAMPSYSASQNELEDLVNDILTVE